MCDISINIAETFSGALAMNIKKMYSMLSKFLCLLLYIQICNSSEFLQMAHERKVFLKKYEISTYHRM